MNITSNKIFHLNETDLEEAVRLFLESKDVFYEGASVEFNAETDNEEKLFNFSCDVHFTNTQTDV